MNFEKSAEASKKRKGKSGGVRTRLFTAAIAVGAMLGFAGCARNDGTMRSYGAADGLNAGHARSVAGRAAIAPANGITARGMVESVHRRNVYTTLGTMVDRVYVEAGDAVSEGQILGVLDTADIVTEANIARASLGMAEINLEAARHNHDILVTLHESLAVPQNDLRQSEFAVRLALAANEQARAVYDGIRAVLERSIIRSPMDGTVTAVIAREGGIGMGRLFVVEDTDNVRVMTTFREYDIARLERGKEVAITSYATGGAVYRGVITRINPAATAFAPVVEFEAEVLVTSPDTSLRIGTNARLNIVY